MFIKGMDISSLPEYLDGGEKFYAADGRCVDAFDLLEENHVNSVRLRIWNEPERVPEAKGYCNLAHTMQMAKKIKEKGMHFMLDFHYSDFWADPERQRKPKAWENLGYEELKTAVYEYTKQVLTTLEEAGCLPDTVQVGNEIRSGMLFPDGAVPNYKQLAGLVNAGIRAVREISPEIEVLIHLDQGGRFYYLKYWFDSMFEAGLDKIDAIGISFYSFWHGTFMDLRDSMKQLIDRYQVPVYVAETAHPWRHCEKEHVSADIMKTAGLPAGIEEQKKSLELIMQIAASVSGEHRTGVYYWEPLGIPGRTYGSWPENMGILDETGKALPALGVYRDFDPSNPPVENLDEYMESLYEVDEKDFLPTGTNLISNGDFSKGIDGWWIVTNPDNVTAEISENELYVSSESNFTFYLHRDVYINKQGKYQLSVDYRGTNTTGVEVVLFLKVIRCNGEEYFEKKIFPSDIRFVTHVTDVMELPVGQVQFGIHMNASPLFGRMKNFRLVEIE